MTKSQKYDIETVMEGLKMSNNSGNHGERRLCTVAFNISNINDDSCTLIGCVVSCNEPDVYEGQAVSVDNRSKRYLQTIAEANSLISGSLHYVCNVWENPKAVNAEWHVDSFVDDYLIKESTHQPTGDAPPGGPCSEISDFFRRGEALGLNRAQ